MASPVAARPEAATSTQPREYTLTRQPGARVGDATAAGDGTSAGATTAARAERACGSCTACCEGWAEGEIRGHRMFPGQHCNFLRQGCCTIYTERPQSPCRQFVCAWLAPGSPFPEAFRPDRIGVIPLPLRWRDRRTWVLVPAGRDPDDELLNWMRAHAQATGTPFFYERQGERIGFGPPQFQLEMQQRWQRGERLW